MANADEQIGRNVAALRDRRAMSQKDVADRMREQGWKWSQATVWSVEKGERPLRLAEADDLAGILAISPTQLTWPDDATRIHSAMHRVSSAHATLKEAISEFKMRQWELAMIADEGGEAISNSNFREAIEDWLMKSPQDVALEVVREDEAEGLKDRFLSSHIISEERDAELRRESKGRNGLFLNLLDKQGERHGIDSEAS